MHQLQFTLKQHTPIIHFQHEQDGATLRATEVKPKLDRFIIQQLGGIDNCREQHSEWFISSKHNALKYKIKITPISKPKYIDLIQMETFYDNEKGKMDFIRGKDGSFPTFFGNMMKAEDFQSDETPYKKMSYYENLKLDIICFNQKLKKGIEDNIVEFFFTHNFGTRQSKGFGSFTVDKSTILLKRPYLEFIKPEDDIASVFKVINYYHLRLKSGVNFSSYDRRNNIQKCHYKEAYIKEFIRNEKTGYEWDKRWMKEEFFPIPKNTSDKRYVRALLGLSYDYKFTTRTNPCNKTTKVPTNIAFNLSLDNTNEVQRIMSPILYKPIFINNNWRVYILVDDRHISNALDKNFQFNSNVRTHISKSIKTPALTLDFNKLISDYNNTLGSTFSAFEFNMKTIDVKIK